jgi:hypothetical protein
MPLHKLSFPFLEVFMRLVSLLTTVALVSASSAFAQSGAPVPLDQQLQRLQLNKAPAPTTTTTSTERKTFTPSTVTTTTTTNVTTPVANPNGLPVARNGEIINSVGGGAISALPLMMITENGIGYISGGIGDEENDQLNAQASNFNVQLLITGMSGEFASNVMLIVKDAKGATLVTLPDAGPKVYLNAPAGSYTIEASTGSSSKSLKITAPAKGTFKSQIRL